MCAGGATAQPAAAPAPEAPRRREHVITFWANHVFTVDDGVQPPSRAGCQLYCS